MFLSFFIWQFQLFLKFLPFIIALSWIMISALYDVEFVLYQSLLLCVFFYFVDLIERFLSHYFSVDKQILFSIINSTTLAVLFANIIGLSSGITKSVSDSWLKKTTTVTYGFIIQLIEPLLMLIEMIQIITFILNFGETLRSKIFDEDNSSSSSLYKIITILLTLVNSLLAFWIIWCDTIQNEQLLLMKISTIILMGMAMAVYIYNIYHEYIIVDASFVWLYYYWIGKDKGHEISIANSMVAKAICNQFDYSRLLDENAPMKSILIAVNYMGVEFFLWSQCNPYSIFDYSEFRVTQ
ncbi:hypothetical protein DERP_008149 [Dermatophagoides pteronyssinus]|uniref:Uncharacterized protein n=1 Tax=Dermatophagoides pteronyssinus TaxID=6956 RepID=A0ABQ8JJW1_DERPT|nr:hypothetical protein DERP_008149 [Dermatophagoides pteronyssinus]